MEFDVEVAKHRSTYRRSGHLLVDRVLKKTMCIWWNEWQTAEWPAEVRPSGWCCRMMRWGLGSRHSRIP